MSCHGCASKYSLFNKEFGCPQCGFSYCSNCLKYKAVVPKLGNTEHLVCKSCETALRDVQRRNAEREHPAASLQRLASLESPPRPPITVYKHDQRIQQLKAGLTQTDREIAERLERLQEDRKRARLPSEDEIAERLALLKGENPTRATSAESKVVVSRSEQQQADDLLAQFHEEQQLAASHSSQAVDEITLRLAQLRGQPHSQLSGRQKGNVDSTNIAEESSSIESMQLGEVDSLLTQFSAELEKDAASCVQEARSLLKKDKPKQETDAAMLMSDDDHDECEEEIIKKVLAEAALEEKLELSDVSGDDVDEDDGCCVICDGKATLKCPDCSGDTYCATCFKEGHDNFDMKDHKAIPYAPTKAK